jgi:predicted extracellular nuclease
MSRSKVFAAVAVIVCIAGTARADVFITEWMYSAAVGEYVELSNIGPSSVDMTGWSYRDDDISHTPESLSGFGTIAPGESVILTEATAAAFRTEWGLSASVKVLGGFTNNLGRNDAIFIYDDTAALADTLDFGDQDFAGSIRTQNVSGVPMTPSALGADDIYQWKFSILFDEYGTYTSLGGDRGNPGFYANIVPEPGSIVLAVLGLVGLLGTRRRS